MFFYRTSGTKKRRHPDDASFIPAMPGSICFSGWANSQSSSETVSLFLPLRRRAASTFLPLAVDILLRKPCLLALFLVEGWNVLFIIIYLFYPIIQSFSCLLGLKFGVAKVHKKFNMETKKYFHQTNYKCKYQNFNH